MHPIYFEGAQEIRKPENMTDEECSSIWAMPVDTPAGTDDQGNQLVTRRWIEAWQPSKEDIEAINRGQPIYIIICSAGLPPVSVVTLNEKGESNDE